MVSVPVAPGRNFFKNFGEYMRAILFYILFSLSLAGMTQSPVLYFRNLTTLEGLSHNKVNCILQDQRGFTWIGTDDGLNRYDGNRFQIFRHDPTNSASVSGNIITDLLEDKDGVLWIATQDGGLSRYDFRLPVSQQFRQFRHSVSDTSSIPINIINSLVEDWQGFLWLATSGYGVLRFDKRTERFSQPVRSRSRTNLQLAMDRQGKIWVGRQGGGLSKIDPRNFRQEEDERYANVYAKLPHMTVAALFLDSQDQMWMGSWDKVVYRVDPKTGDETVFGKTKDPWGFPGDDPLCFAEDAQHRIWIGAKYDGLYIYNPTSQKFDHYRHDPAREGTLNNNQVNCLYIDKSGIVWAGTNHGISIHDPSQQQFEQTFLSPSSNEDLVIYDFLNDAGGNLLIGTSSGLYKRDRYDGSISYYPLKHRNEQPAITKFFRSANGSLYVGTNISLYKTDEMNFALSLLPNTEKDEVMNRIIESRVVSIIEDSIEGHPVLLASPYGHYIAYYDFALRKWVSRQDSSRQILKRFNIRDNLVRKFYKTSKGAIWVANTKMGLAEWIRIPSPRLAFYSNIPNDPSSISNNNVFDIAEDAHGNLWVSTSGGGLNYFNTQTRKFEHIKASQNLTEGIATDARGNVWMIANGNLHKYDPRRKSYSTYRLPDLEKTGGVRGYIFKDESGKMYVAGNKYYISFHPDSVRDVSWQPKVFLTDFRIFNNSFNELLFEDEIVLKHNENFFTMEYAAPGYQPGHPVLYAHKLEGVDADWVEDGARNSVPYTNLDGGNYTFKVRATVKPGVWGKEVSMVRIRIIPPVWKTWWFYVLCAIFTGLIIYGIYRYRINEILKRQAIRNKIAQDLHDNVGSTLSSISVYSQVAKIYQQQEKDAALKDTLEKISSTSSEMISEMNDIVWAINPRNDNMATILQRMESFARPLLSSQEIRFHFHYEQGIEQLHLEMTKRKNFYLIFKEAINNALKYSGCRNIWVDIGHHQQQLSLEVRDDGKGFDTRQARSANTLSGNGLQNIRIRAREMRGTCVVESRADEGTKITLRFPIP